MKLQKLDNFKFKKSNKMEIRTILNRTKILILILKITILVNKKGKV